MLRKKIRTQKDVDDVYSSFKQGDVFVRYKKYQEGSKTDCRTFRVTKKQKTLEIHKYGNRTEVTYTYKVYLKPTDNSRSWSDRFSITELFEAHSKATGAAKVLFGK